MVINATQSYLKAPDKTAINAPTVTVGSSAKKPDESDSDFSFWDLLDVVNPLQQIPIVGSIYRAVTGDTIKPAAQIAGSALFGGAVGLAAGVASALFENAIGGDPVTMAYNAITGSNEESQIADTGTLQTASLSRSDENSAAVTLPGVQAQSNSDALAQLAADMRGNSANGDKTNSAVTATDATAANTAGPSKLFQSLQASAPAQLAMPHQAQQFMKPAAAAKQLSSLSSATTGKPQVPMIDIHAPQNAASAPVTAMQASVQTNTQNNATAPTRIPNNQIANQMMRALNAYQAQSGTDNFSGGLPGNPFGASVNSATAIGF